MRTICGSIGLLGEASKVRGSARQESPHAPHACGLIWASRHGSLVASKKAHIAQRIPSMHIV